MCDECVVFDYGIWCWVNMVFGVGAGAVIGVWRLAFGVNFIFRLIPLVYGGPQTKPYDGDRKVMV